jgi:hypothetical protein
MTAPGNRPAGRRQGSGRHLAFGTPGKHRTGRRDETGRNTVERPTTANARARQGACESQEALDRNASREGHSRAGLQPVPIR